MIKFAAVFGSQGCYSQLSHIKQRLAESFDANSPGLFSESVEYLLVTIFISGEVEDYELDGCSKLRFQPKKRRLMIDLGVTEESWRDQTTESIAEFLADEVDVAYDKAAAWCVKRKEAPPNREKVELALSKFLKGLGIQKGETEGRID